MDEKQGKPLYRIIDWEKHYEHGHSKTVDKKSYQHFPNRQDGLGYKRLVANKEEGERHYGCFCAMILTLSKQDKSVRAGWLTHDGKPDGERYTALDLALMSGCTEVGMLGMLKACTGKGIAWIEVVKGDVKDIPVEPAKPESPEDIPAEGNVLKLCEALKGFIFANDPKRKTPEEFFSNKGWGAEARKLLDVDDRDYEEIIRVMKFGTSDGFWRANILSMSKFRKQYTALLLKMKKGGSKPVDRNKGQNSGVPDYDKA